MNPLPSLRGVAVLVVDDHLDTLEMFEQVLGAAGAVVLTAASGADALGIARRALPAVIVTDIAMPGGDAFWFISELRNLPGGSAVPVIALSGRPLDLLGDAGKAAEFSVALLKPVDPVDLCEIISKILAGASKSRQGARRSGTLTLGALVGSPSKPDWIGEVVDTSRLRSGYVTVRWRTPSGTSLQSMEERVDSLVLLPPIRGGADQPV